ncbi:hypothetical protein M9458_052476, partial [Cirrhinus mrigala]
RDRTRLHRIAHPVTRSVGCFSGYEGRMAVCGGVCLPGTGRRSLLLKEHMYLTLIYVFGSLKSEEANLHFPRPKRTQAANQACIGVGYECVFV